MNDKISNFVKKYAFSLVAIFFVALFLVDMIFIFPNLSRTDKWSPDGYAREENVFRKEKNIPKLSEIKGERIDDLAARISCAEDQKVEPERACSGLPAGVWVMLLLAYVGLIVFNLAYEFGKTREIRWFWETVYTAIFVGGWAYLDRCGEFVWFPLYVIKLGIIIFVFYLYQTGRSVGQQDN